MARFDLNLLSALDALLSERNVTRAADKLHVTQPTMSGMLQRLRYQFNDQLLVRNGRVMEVTPFAAALVDPVREALRGVEALVRAEPIFDALTSSRTFTLMASDYCTSMFLPRVVARLATCAPGVRLAMQPLNAPVERMCAAEIDLFISADNLSLLCRDGADERLHAEYLFSDDFVCIVDRLHPISDTPTLDQYLSYPHVGIVMEGLLASIESEAIGRHAPHYRPSYVVPEFSLVPPMVANTRLIGVVQRRLAQVAAATLPIRTFKPPFPIPELKETLLWHPRHLEDPAHRWLRTLILDEARRWLDDGDVAQPAGATATRRSKGGGVPLRIVTG